MWWSLKQIYDKGPAVQGAQGGAVLPRCCGTALSSHEVAQGYKDVSETSVFVRFAVSGEENTYILAWTTTPWTLPSNVGLCVNPDETYVYAKAEDGCVYILAQGRCAHRCWARGRRCKSRCWGASWWGFRTSRCSISRKTIRYLLYRGGRRLRHTDRWQRRGAHCPGLWRGRQPRGPRLRPAVCADGGRARRRWTPARRGPACSARMQTR